MKIEYDVYEFLWCVLVFGGDECSEVVVEVVLYVLDFDDDHVIVVECDLFVWEIVCCVWCGGGVLGFVEFDGEDLVVV